MEGRSVKGGEWAAGRALAEFEELLTEQMAWGVEAPKIQPPGGCDLCLEQSAVPRAKIR